ncbi:MAG: D-glycero-beta-D-manno-heptose 1-phosphate adenylyltransferase [Rhodospirillales bacterium]|nr:MAG: D-glycero-beta-D-manno-heptose 1-phosphate adenylyltransferase [Rhodospirillales bacterium]
MSYSKSSLVSLVDAMAGVPVLCVGDVMLDRYVAGTVERISPEAPIPVLKVDGETEMLGGAGNVVRNLVALRAVPRLVSAVGEDAAAAAIATALSTLGCGDGALVPEAGRQTGVKVRFMAGGQQMLRADHETVAPLGSVARTAVLQAVTARMDGSGAVVLSDYGKGVLADGIAGEVIAGAKASGRPVIVDPKGRDFSCYRDADVITPNRLELSEATSMPVTGANDAIHAARALLHRHGFGAVVATLGKDGMAVVPAAGEPLLLAAEAREVFDVSGAGDTVVATLAAALGAGVPLGEAAALANVAAAIVVGKVGTAVAYAAEVTDALRHQDISAAEAKVMALESAIDRVRGWRRRRLKVGFTNGCFDLLHPGHVSLLAQARRACDRLVVGLNSDASVARLKGAGRPVQGEAARATVLASLADVDMVVIFAEDTPIRLIQALRPDVLVKGADYRLNEVVGADLVQGWGGTVALARLEPGFSTSATIARLNTGAP